MTVRIALKAIVLVIVLGAVGAGAAYAYSASQTSEYSTSAELLFGGARPELIVLGDAFARGNAPDERQSASNSLVVDNVAYARAVTKVTGIPLGEVQAAIQVRPARGTNVVTIQATSSRPERAQRLANEYARQFLVRRRAAERRRARLARSAIQARYLSLPKSRRGTLEGITLQQQIGQLVAIERVPFGGVELIQSAALPSVATSATQRTVIFGGLFGLVLAIALVSVLVRPRIASDG